MIVLKKNIIKTLAAQPTTVPLMSIPITQAIIPNEAKNADLAVNNEIDSESVSRTTQLGKLCLENILKSLQENHEQEISILEDSYKYILGVFLFMHIKYLAGCI